MEEKKNKTIGIVALVVAILSFIITLLPAKELSTVKIVLIISTILSIAAIILGIIGKKNAKGMSIAAIIIGIIGTIIFAISVISFEIIGQFTNCVDKGDGTAT